MSKCLVCPCYVPAMPRCTDTPSHISVCCLEKGVLLAPFADVPPAHGSGATGIQAHCQPRVVHLMPGFHHSCSVVSRYSRPSQRGFARDWSLASLSGGSQSLNRASTTVLLPHQTIEPPHTYIVYLHSAPHPRQIKIRFEMPQLGSPNESLREWCPLRSG